MRSICSTEPVTFARTLASAAISLPQRGGGKSVNRANPLEVVYGFGAEELRGLPAKAQIADIRAYMRRVLGIPADATAWLDGRLTHGTDPIGYSATLEFKVARGEKRWAWTEDDLVENYPSVEEAVVRRRLAEYGDAHRGDHPTARFLADGDVWYRDTPALRAFLAQEFGPAHGLSGEIVSAEAMAEAVARIIKSDGIVQTVSDSTTAMEVLRWARKKGFTQTRQGRLLRLQHIAKAAGQGRISNNGKKGKGENGLRLNGASAREWVREHCILEQPTEKKANKPKTEWRKCIPLEHCRKCNELVGLLHTTTGRCSDCHA